MRAEVRQGLDRVDLLPVGRGYAELSAGVRGTPGGDVLGYARGEVGYRPTSALSLFGFGEADVTLGGRLLPPSWMAGIGARYSF